MRRNWRKADGKKTNSSSNKQLLKFASFVGQNLFSRQAFIVISGLYLYYQYRKQSENSDDSKLPASGNGWLADAFGVKTLKDKSYELKVTSLNEKYDNYINSVKISMPGNNESAIILRHQIILKMFNGLSREHVLQLCKLSSESFQKIEENSKKWGLELSKEKSKQNEALLKEFSKNEEVLLLAVAQVFRQFIVSEADKFKWDRLLDKQSRSDWYTLMRKLAVSLHRRVSSRVFVLSFPGDMMASQVAYLREEISAVLLTADPEAGDYVILNLNSGGGTVTGYGLAAAQLARLKAAGLKLVVCVDEVAASGGYMMAAVADHIAVSPFAVLGSVGVISSLPNFAERMEREGISWEDVTAGKYKRTMTPYKRNTDEEREKVQEDVNEVLKLFKSFLKTHRPSLDVDSIATGETWLGSDALKRGLCDQIITSDDMLLSCRKEGKDIYSVKYSPAPKRSGSLFSLSEDGSMSVDFTTVRSFLQKQIWDSLNQQTGARGLPFGSGVTTTIPTAANGIALKTQPSTSLPVMARTLAVDASIHSDAL